MQKVLITGGSGFVGHWIRTMSPVPDTDCTYLNRVDYESGNWKKDKYDYIIHAAHISPKEVIQQAKDNNAKLVYISSGAVYHRYLNQYGNEKTEWESMVEDTRLEFCIARLFTFCGYRLKWENFAIGNFIMNAIKNKPIHIWGDGTMTRSYMYGSDLGEWIWKITMDGEDMKAYNVGSPQPVTMVELAEEVVKHFAGKSEIIIDNNGGFEQSHTYVPITNLTESDLNVRIKVPFEKAVERAVEDYFNERVI